MSEFPATVVSDTSVVLNLCWLRHEHLLEQLFVRVLVPGAVHAEFLRKAAEDVRFQGLPFPSFITIAEPNALPSDLAQDPSLDPGEIAAIALALERGISTVLIDEQAGRAAAIQAGLRVSGLLGVLIAAKRRGRIAAVEPLLERLITGARFWIDDALRARVISLAGEAAER
jgi:predicted nucleic acid-binding protein